MKRKYDYIKELFPWSPDDFPGRPRAKRVLRRLVREACARLADNYYVSSVAGAIANQIRARAKGTP